MSKIIIIRHGAYDYDKKKNIFRLSDAGEKQMVGHAKKIMDMTPQPETVAIISSISRRARESAGIICDGLVKLNPLLICHGELWQDGLHDGDFKKSLEIIKFWIKTKEFIIVISHIGSVPLLTNALASHDILCRGSNCGEGWIVENGIAKLFPDSLS